MGKVFLQGLAVLIAGFVCLVLNQLLNLGLGSVVFGLAMGAILGLVGDGGPIGKALAFVVGIIVAMVLYIARVLFLNDSFAGNVIVILLGLVLVTVICALTSGRLPLWAALAGVALITGAYETAFVDTPQNLLTELFQYTTMALVPAGFGYLATIFVTDRVVPASEARAPATPSESPPMAPATAAPATAPAPPPSAPPNTSGTNRQV
jgi:hypothetical protein